MFRHPHSSHASVFHTATPGTRSVVVLLTCAIAVALGTAPPQARQAGTPPPEARVRASSRVLHAGIYPREIVHRKKKRKTFRAVTL